jgi:hypothetical protein
MMPAAVTDAAVLLLRALRVAARAAGATVTIRATDERCWASATFAGIRHRIDLAIEADVATLDWLAGLSEADLPMRGHLVADLVVERDGHQARIEALTIEHDDT